MNDNKVALTVVRFLGLGAIVGLAVTGFLVYRALDYEGDPATVALIGSVSSLASLFAGSLASILASTRGSSPTPVTVENPPSAPVPTTEAPATADVTAGVNPVVTLHPDAPAESDL